MTTYGIGDVPIEVEISSLKQTIFDVVSFTLNTFLVSLGDNKNKCPETQISELPPCTNMPLNEAVVTNIPPNNLQSRTEERTAEQTEGRGGDKLDPANCMKV